VDIYTIFPDFGKDPSDPSSYDFATTDEYIRTVVETGARIVYRLGVSIEHTKEKYYVGPPEDFAKWAQICVGIIRHYNQGWANGFHYNIEYWEIWNEPDKPVGKTNLMWGGTWEQFYELYGVAAKAIKQFDPSLKVGGYGATSVKVKKFMDEFLAYCRDHEVPLDFFSWHIYGADLQRFASESRYARQELDRYGFPQAESHLNEWNYFDGDFKTIWLPGNEFVRRGVFERQKSNVGASFAAAVLTLLQDLPVDAANYYDGQPTALFCGLFDYYGVPQKTYYAFDAFRQLCEHRIRVEVNPDPSVTGVYSLAGTNGLGETAAMISNADGPSRHYTIGLSGLDDRRDLLCEQYRLDDQHALQLVDSSRIRAGEHEFRIFLPRHSILFLKLTRAS
jgi:beta-xylosidase